MKFDEYAAHDGLGLAALVARGEVSPAELVDAAIARIEALEACRSRSTRSAVA